MSNLREAEERKAFDDWLHQTPAFARSIVNAWDVWQARAALAQPEPEWVLSQNELPPPYVAREPIAQPEPAAPSEDRPLFDPEYPDSGYCTNAEWAARKSAQAAASTVVEPLIGCVGHDCAECQARAATPPRAALTDEQIHDCFQQKHKDKATERRMITRAVEAAHNIGGPRNE